MGPHYVGRGVRRGLRRLAVVVLEEFVRRLEALEQDLRTDGKDGAASGFFIKRSNDGAEVSELVGLYLIGHWFRQGTSEVGLYRAHDVELWNPEFK